jgi:uncharacterized membrane protein
MMRGYGYSYGPGMMGYSPWSGLALFFFWLVLLAAVGLLIFWAIRQSGHHHNGAPLPPGAVPPTHPTHDEAMAIARRRLAAGEITPAEFEEIRKALNG